MDMDAGNTSIFPLIIQCATHLNLGWKIMKEILFHLEQLLVKLRFLRCFSLSLDSPISCHSSILWMLLNC